MSDDQQEATSVFFFLIIIIYTLFPNSRWAFQHEQKDRSRTVEGHIN